MKKFLIGIGLICLSFVASAFYPVRYKPNDGDLPFNAYCPGFLYFIPSSYLNRLLDKGALIFLGGERSACILNRLLNSDKPDESGIYLNSVLLTTNRPDLAAHFLKIFVDKDNIFAAQDLGLLYADGHGVPLDKERAKHLLRYSFSMNFPTMESGAACRKQIDSSFDPKQHPFLQEQLRWFQSLCDKDGKELYAIARWYLDEDNPYRQPAISEEIYRHLYDARKDEHAWGLWKNARAISKSE